ncbi:MAG: N-acetylmuramoyl-L-alanine amidase, partial [Coriobacteriaceae bacterium]|nr:N-acetylmuramoyl-L-alanine amidase [Coriobacteriaceae bacterium]
MRNLRKPVRLRKTLLVALSGILVVTLLPIGFASAHEGGLGIDPAIGLAADPAINPAAGLEDASESSPDGTLDGQGHEPVPVEGTDPSGPAEGLTRDQGEGGAEAEGIVSDDGEPGPASALALQESPQESQDPDEGDEGDAGDARSTGISVDAAEVIEYVYFEETVLVLGQEQNIVFGLIDEAAVVTEAKITFTKTNTGAAKAYPAAATAGNAALFTMSFNGPEAATGYRLAEIAYSVKGFEGVYRADFLTAVEAEGGGYFFDVVTQEVADVVAELPTEEGDVSAFAITDEGSFIAAESVEEALLIADAEGIYNIEAEESLAAYADTPALLPQPQPGALAVAGLSLLGPLAALFAPQQAHAAPSAAREEYLIVALDPGHGANDPGASGHGLQEKNLNWQIANACYNELLAYTGVSPVLTRGENENPGLQDRVNRAVAAGADVFISIHNNASGTGAARGAEVWVPNNASYNRQTATTGTQLGQKILAQITSLGLANRGIKTRDNTSREKYPDGSLADYYTVINASRRAGIPGIIIEHAFIDNASDASKLKDKAFLNKLGVADATGIAQQYSLATHKAAQKVATVKYRAFVAKLSWQAYVYDQKVSGTTGKGKGIEGIDIQLQNQGTTGLIQYNAYVTGVGWQGWKDSGQLAGTAGQSRTIQAVQIRLTGDMANKYDVYYRVHSANVGWLGWAKNGASAGTVGYSYNAEAYEVAVVAKGAAAPGPTAAPYRDKAGTVSASPAPASVQYQMHVQNIGWQNPVKDGATAGTTGRSLRIEGVRISLPNKPYAGNI